MSVLWWTDDYWFDTGITFEHGTIYYQYKNVGFSRLKGCQIFFQYVRCFKASVLGENDLQHLMQSFQRKDKRDTLSTSQLAKLGLEILTTKFCCSYETWVASGGQNNIFYFQSCVWREFCLLRHIIFYFESLYKWMKV